MNKLGIYPFSYYNKMAVRFCQLTAFVLLLLLPFCSYSQRVGVVLSGGGAKGVAHVGVLKALEEHGIPIDYIAGTSMGAIIGGMYASGMSPDSIEAIVTSGEFQSWALGTIDEEYNFFYKRLPPDPSWVSVKFSIDSVWQYQLPSSLISPAQMDFAGMQYLSAVNVVSRNNFDSLFVPFRCVAADIERKEQVIFRKGEIFPAIRASMTYPFVFRPTRVDGRLLFDGGIYNNFPVDVMEQDFNPDFIIGSAVTQGFNPPTEDNILSHIENLLVFQTDYNISPERGMVIRPDLPRTNVTDFSNSESFIAIGYGAAIELIEQIKENVGRQVSANERNQKREQFNSRKPPMIIDRIFIRGVNEAQMDYIYKLLYERKPTPIEQIKVEYFKLLAEEHIERIAPRVIFNRNTGYFDLYLDVTLDKKFILNFGGNISTGPQNVTYLEAQYQHLGFQAYTGIVNVYVGRFYNSLKLMGRMAFPTATPFFLESSYTLNNFNYFRTNTLYFQDRTPSFLRINQNFLDLTAGVPATYTGKILLGTTAGFLNHDYYQTNQFARTDTTDRTNFRFFSPYLIYERNTLNRKQYPSQGTFFSVRGRHVSGSEVHFPGSTSPLNNISRQKHDWWQLRAEYLNYFTSMNNFKLGFYSEMLLSNKKLFSNHTSSLLSAPRFDLVPETRTIYLPNYRANNFAVLGLQGIFSLSNFVDFRLEGYVFQPFREIISEDNGRPILGKAFQKRYGLVSASVVANTPLGPAAISINFYDRYETPFTISFNFGYLIFNQAPLR